MASALVQLDRRDASRDAQLAEPLGDMVRLPRAAVGLAEHKLRIGQPADLRGELLLLAVLLDQPGRLRPR